MIQATFVIIWNYIVQSDRQAEFEQAYGPNGEWADLFRKSAGYIRTDLLRDTTSENTYTTIDYWTSEDRYDAFHIEHSTEYEVLDARFETWTINEQLIGRFTIVSE